MEATPAGWHASQFFSPWEPLPPFAPPPEDTNLAERVRKTVEFAVRNGPQFIQVLQARQKDNAEYTFLFGGAGSAYYSWALYCLVYQHPIDEPPPPAHTVMPASSQAAAVAAPQYATGPATALGGMPAEVEQGFAQVLASLTGSKDSIKASQGWFMACAPYAGGMAIMIARRLVELAEYEKQLHLIYLANDILFRSLSQRQPGADPLSDHIAQAFKPVLGIMLAAAFRTGGQTDEVKSKLSKILSFWAERSVLDAAAITMIEQQMATADPAALLAQVQQASQPSSSVAPTVVASHPQFTTPGYAAPPQHLAPPSAAAGTSSSPYPGGMPWLGGAAAAAWAAPPMQHYPMPLGSAGHAAATPGSGGVPGAWPAGAPMGYHPGPAAPPGYAPPPLQGAYPAYPAAVAAVPHAMPPFGGPAVIPAPVVPAPFPSPAMPQPRPINSFCFPPGLLPKLVREKNRDDDPYSPLHPSDIERAGLPPAPEKDAYMRSRLERFYAEISEYRQGSSRADVEEQRERERRDRGGAVEGDEDYGSRRRRNKGFEPAMADPETGMMPDGSFAGGAGLGSESQYAGLGSHSQASQSVSEDDMYQQYRRARSGVYHEVLAKGTAVAPVAFAPSAKVGR